MTYSEKLNVFIRASQFFGSWSQKWQGNREDWEIDHKQFAATNETEKYEWKGLSEARDNWIANNWIFWTW